MPSLFREGRLGQVAQTKRGGDSSNPPYGPVRGLDARPAKEHVTRVNATSNASVDYHSLTFFWFHRCKADRSALLGLAGLALRTDLSKLLLAGVSRRKYVNVTALMVLVVVPEYHRKYPIDPVFRLATLAATSAIASTSDGRRRVMTSDAQGDSGVLS